MPLSIGHYLNNLTSLTNQWNKYNYKEPDRQRIYLKDIDCPQIWHDKLQAQIPASVFYLNESTGDFGGPGSFDQKSFGIARAGDLMSCLPPAMRAENLMCYIGHEGTYTPAHREMCASLGQNLMVEASGTTYEDGKPTKPGSSIWFMTETKDRNLVSEYWLSTLGHDIEIESHFAQINAWKAAPFNTYIVEQKVGDFILIPPLAPHQVWNRGTRTMKVAWNRTTVETLEMALDEALPRARMVCRDEQYKNKAIVLFALERYSRLLTAVEYQKRVAANPQTQLDLSYSPKIRQLQKDFRRLFSLYNEILLSESLAPDTSIYKNTEYIPYDSNITCSYCRCNIFNRFLTCTTCIIPLQKGEEDTYDICMECYAMGRSCRCNSGYKWVEQFPWPELLQKHETWRDQIIAFDGLNEKSPKPFSIQRQNRKTKTLAQVCYEQLKTRPWLDPAKELPEAPYRLCRGVPVTEEHVNADGSIKKKKIMRRSKAVEEAHPRCHVCLWPEFKWKVHICECGRAYCYGSLFRGFDQSPLSVMQNPDWKCPRCLKICSCAQCRKLKDAKPYEPRGTLLGYDVKKVADPRSWDSLVNYSQSNIQWLKRLGDDRHGTKRLQRRQREADLAKSKDPALDDNYVHDDELLGQGDRNSNQAADDEIPIDPTLLDGAPTPSSVVNGDHGFAPSFSNFATPTVPMVEKHHEGGKIIATDVNGIRFEYTDPTPTTPQTNDFIPPTTTIQDAPQTQKGALMQRSSEVPAHNDADTETAARAYQAMLQQGITEPDSNHRASRPRTDSLMLKLRVSGPKLLQIQGRSGPEPAKRSEATILQSDLLPDGTSSAARNAKRRLTREEKDEDFGPRKKLKKGETGPKRPHSPEPIEKDSSESEEDSTTVNGFKPINGSRRPRALPAYLARRNLDMHDQTQQDEDQSREPKKRKRRSRPATTSAGATPSEPKQTNAMTPHGSSADSHRRARREGTPHSTDNAAVDAFPPKPLPQSEPGVDLSKLGPGKAEEDVQVTMDDATPSMDGVLPPMFDGTTPSETAKGQPSPPMDEAARRAEENRKAKLRALMWAEGGGGSDDDDYDDAMIDAF